MASQRPPSSLGRPMSRSGSVVPGAGRPLTAVRPPPTAIRVGTGMVPGTSGPGLRGGIPLATPGVLSAQIKVTDRPVTQQGLSGMKTGPQRQILDKSYYFGLLRSKFNELTTETSKLHKEIDNYNQENSVYLSYEKRAESLAAEIKDFQGQLADYNMVNSCKLNENHLISSIVPSSIPSQLKAQNDNEADSIDSVFTERREREEAIRAVDEGIRRERQVADEVVQSMPAAKQEKYLTMASANEELLQELTVLQEEVDHLVTRKEDYEAELANSQIKQEVVRLHESLSALQVKRDAMEVEQKTLGSPQEEREKLLKQVKEDNKEIASMERHRPCFVSGFLESFEESRVQVQETMTQSQEDIVSLLEHCSRSMLRLRQVDTVTASELRNMQEVLVSKETEVVQSASTARGLTTESQRLQQDLEKVQQLEGKITGELSTLKERVGTMETELHTYRDLDNLRHTAEDKKKVTRACERDMDAPQILESRRDSFRQLLDEMKQKYEAVKTKLQENETHAELANLERKWQHLEQNNFVMKEFIASKSQESDYDSVAKIVSQQVAEYNKCLIDSAWSTSGRRH
uniref:Intraflagellar transport protein 74-like n=1 Tax=Scophthalmus maximus TaxID=52904 RepID=A0A8D3E141_SCOMX